VAGSRRDGPTPEDKLEALHYQLIGAVADLASSGRATSIVGHSVVSIQVIERMTRPRSSCQTRPWVQGDPLGQQSLGEARTQADQEEVRRGGAVTADARGNDRGGRAGGGPRRPVLHRAVHSVQVRDFVRVRRERQLRHLGRGTDHHRVRRDPASPGELIHHSDAGSQYTSVRLTEHLALEQIRHSIGTVGDAYDNALMETINGLYKAEAIRTTVFHDGPYKTLADVEYATAGWVDWYNNRRLHSSLGMVPPVEFEQAHYAALNREPQPA